MGSEIQIWQILVYLIFPIIVAGFTYFINHLHGRIGALELDAKNDSGTIQRIADLEKRCDRYDDVISQSEYKIRELELSFVRIEGKLDAILEQIKAGHR